MACDVKYPAIPAGKEDTLMEDADDESPIEMLPIEMIVKILRYVDRFDRIWCMRLSKIFKSAVDIIEKHTERKSFGWSACVQTRSRIQLACNLKKSIFFPGPDSPCAILSACEFGNIDALVDLMTRGYIMDINKSIGACIRGDNRPCLRFICEEMVLGSGKERQLRARVVRGSRVSILNPSIRYRHWDPHPHYDNLRRIIWWNRYECFVMFVKLKLVYVSNEIIEDCIENGRLRFLRYLLDLGWPKPRKYACELAARCGHLHIVKYLIEVNQKYSEYVAYGAARYGNVEILKFLHGCGYAFTRNVLRNAGFGDSTNCMEFLYAIGMRFDAEDIRYFITWNDIEPLRWMRERGVRFGLEHLDQAINQRKEKAARFLYEDITSRNEIDERLRVRMKILNVLWPDSETEEDTSDDDMYL